MPQKMQLHKKPPVPDTQSKEHNRSERESTLTLRQAKFVQRYTTHGNAARAAREAGYSAFGAKVAGGRLLATPHIRALVQEEAQAQVKHAKISRERLATEVGRVAFSDPRMLYDENGKRKDWCDLNANEAAAVGVHEYEIVERTANGENRVLRYRSFDYDPKVKVAGMRLANRMLERAGPEDQKDRLRELVAAIHAPFIAMEEQKAAEKERLRKEAERKALRPAAEPEDSALPEDKEENGGDES